VTVVRVGVLGAGAVGARAVRQLGTTSTALDVVVADVDHMKAERIAAALAPRVTAVATERLRGVDVVVLATPAPHAELAAVHLRAGTSVVSTSDDVSDVDELLKLDPLARQRQRTVLIGAAFAPGMSSLLARYAAARFDQVDEIHVASHGTGGPACARQHHRSLGGLAVTWHDGVWTERAGGSGRELCWFPDPVGAHDCYRAELAEPLLLVPAFPKVSRVSARVSATRRDRVTARLPMLRPPHPEGTLGAVRFEVRGNREGRRDIEVLGAIDRPAVAAGAVAAVAVSHVIAVAARPGAYGMADAGLDTHGLLTELARRGVKAARYVGDAALA
jgi:saccharopine dehydrogenase-like NADP-dependent oxidoreductase